MTKKDYILSAQTLFDFLCGVFGYNWNEIMNRKMVSGSLGDVCVQFEMFDMYKFIQKEDGFLAWKQGISILQETLKSWKGGNTSEELRKHAQLLYDAANFMDGYELVRVDDRNDWLKTLRSMRLLTPEEKESEDIVEVCPRSISEQVDKLLMEKRGIRICRYKGNNSLNMENVSNINIGENFILANNIGDIIMQGKSGKEEEINIYVALNIDRYIDFSYFIIAINNGSNWWMITDEPEFASPKAKEGIAQRGAIRYRRDDYENSIFPYIYIDHIIEWRKENKHLDRDDREKREMYAVPLTDWPVQCRVMLNMLIERVLFKLQNEEENIQRMKFGYEFVNTLLLENKEFQKDEWLDMDTEFENAEKCTNVRRRIENMIFKEDKNNDIVPINSSEIAEKILNWKGSLMTEEKFRKLETWAFCDAEYQRKQNCLKKVGENRRDDEQQMFEMLNKNFHNRIETLFAAKEMMVFIYEPDMEYSGGQRFDWDWKRRVYLSNLHNDSKNTFAFMVDVPGKIGGEIDETCKECGKYPLKEKHVSSIRVHHYAFLAWLAGVKREQLPHWYINYMSHVYMGYSGNNLLDNVNPMYLLKDELSERRSNGLNINIRVCQRCRTSLKKRAMEKGVLVINANTCEMEGLFDMGSFKDFLNKKGIPYSENYF